jgi:DNA-binding response OmpR family regulator/HPt (histidine-containing phosphotransfer) domain-containing protein
MKILVVEDDLVVADALKITLSNWKYAVEIAHDGQAGLEFVEAFDYDLLVLDAVLPKLDGISLCRYVRSQGYMMPILLLTSKDSSHDRAIGLDAGADDYAIKPFEPEELSARIRALLRRGNDRVQPVLNWEHLTLDPRNYEVTYQDRLLNLTPKEYGLLELFLRYSRRLFSCGAILQHLWAYEDTPSEEAVRTHIKGLRHKLKAAGAPVDFIETVYGIGYRLKLSDPLTDRQLGLVPITDDGNRSIATEPIYVSQTPTAADLPDFLIEIWHRHQEQMLDRVASIDRAITDLEHQTLNPEIRDRAWQSAHTLAGALGTFGLALGSQAAKQIELLLDKDIELTLAQVPQLQSDVARLWAEIGSKKTLAQTEIVTPPARSPWLLSISKEPDLVSAWKFTTSDLEVVSATELTPSQLERSPQAVLLDLDCFPQIADGLSALSALDRDYPDLPVLVLSQPDSWQRSTWQQERELPVDDGTIVPQLDRLDRPSSTASEAIANRDRSLPQRIEIARRGARLFLSKPMSAEQISLAVERVLQQAQARQAKVTIVDDDPVLLAGVSALLSTRGMKVTILSEPSRFWETLEASTPDLLILDLDMPTHNGIELCRAVRTDPQWATLPILFLTAHSAALASDRVFAAGADDFVTKPVVDATLVTRIINRLERIGLHRPLDRVLPMGRS